MAAQRGERVAAARMGAGILGVDPDRHIVRLERLVVAAHNVKQKPPAMVRRDVVRVDPDRHIVRLERLVVAAQRGERAPLPG